MVELCIDADVVDIAQHPTIELQVFCADSWGARESLLGSSQVRMPRYGLAFHELTPLSRNQVTTGQLLVFVDATAHWSAADVERDLEHWSALTLAPKEGLEQPSSEATPRAAELSPRYASEGSTVEEPEPECGNGYCCWSNMHQAAFRYLWPVLRACVWFNVWRVRNDRVFRADLPLPSPWTIAVKAAHLHHSLVQEPEQLALRRLLRPLVRWRR
ncbi:hypothetical protein SPRG_04890 [Saprolegnia parasitica CBS 223.65]|uniref:Uncharacterized protein n=1 Tax=Saprolegnia parasitica (strain CBS 223.65) TaxID=695850 RepID=A0A067CGA6_SAPPC|nr:hypothetical protein SPRG_04890 [Saprolegnia parasitica CBS 223.65]KDO29774.1 hypothetical protein SPRG_04890 [Saprolegnia parasitica CBS 223.65]|eukprot:XP_012199420.1 hypothetical protein SPRG_04890 [Saprolegnia parasitica CBS 223.65]